ncbi:MAG: hypothetical protein NVSMB13_02220 [Mycobacteriales bacterium]
MHLDRYREYARCYEDTYKSAPPPLPDPTASFPMQKRTIGVLAAHLCTHGWFDWQTAELLDELGVRTGRGMSFDGSLVAYYRRAYGKRAA